MWKYVSEVQPFIKNGANDILYIVSNNPNINTHPKIVNFVIPETGCGCCSEGDCSFFMIELDDNKEIPTYQYQVRLIRSKYNIHIGKFDGIENIIIDTMNRDELFEYTTWIWIDELESIHIPDLQKKYKFIAACLG